ncbi:FxLYD domain-containing protein [Patescibacteria group bacterium]|nr:FxLYD domain-containing protein [Patescibacteria group bacterium]
MSRVAKQLLYGAGCLIFVFLISFGVYSVWFKKMPARCSQTSCAIENPVVGIASGPVALQTGQDQSVILAALENNNGYGLTFSYNLIVHSILGEQVDTFTGTSSIASEGMRYLLLTGVASNATEIGAIDLSTSDVVQTPSSELPQYNLVISGISTHAVPSGGYVSGTVSNTSTSSASGIHLLAILFDLSGNIIGASAVKIGDLLPMSKTSFSIPLSSMDVRTANSIDSIKTEVSYEVTEN